MKNPTITSKQLADKLFPSVVEAETAILNIPPERRRLSTETYDFTVSTVIDYLESDQMLIPQFQRDYVWNRVQASRLIESLIINCPIPVIFLSQNIDESLSVIDGNQRLNSIDLYIRGGFELQGLTVYPTLNGMKFEDLDTRFQRHILNRTLRCIVITNDTHPQIKFDVFERLNTGSVKLNAQELRNGLNYGSFTKHVESLANFSKFRELTGNLRDKRMKASELSLRYLALSERFSEYQKPMAIFLNNYLEERKDIDKDLTKRQTERFEATFNKLYEILGKYLFKTYDKDLKNLKFNAALFDAQMVGMSIRLEEGEFKKKIDPVAAVKANQAFISSEDFSRLITASTTDRNFVIDRIRRYSDFLKTFH